MRLFVFLLGISFLSPVYANHTDPCSDPTSVYRAGQYGNANISEEACRTNRENTYQNEIDTGAIGVKADEMINFFRDYFLSNVDLVTTLAKNIFFSLLIIEFIWTFGMLALKGSALEEFTVELIKRLVMVGFAMFLFSSPAIFIEVIEGFRDVGAKVITGDQFARASDMNIGDFFQVPIELFMQMLRAALGLPLSDIIEGLVLLLVAVIVFWALLIVVAQFIVVMCEMYITLLAGLFAMCFYSLSFTRPYTMNFFGAVIGIGFKLFALMLIMGLGFSMVESWVGADAVVYHEVKPYVFMAVSAVIFKEIAVKVPDYLQGLFSGTPGSGVSAQGAVSAGMAVAGAAAAGGMGAAKGVRSAGIVSEGVKAAVSNTPGGVGAKAMAGLKHIGGSLEAALTGAATGGSKNIAAHSQSITDAAKTAQSVGGGGDK